ncbi:MAG: GlcG/HbpS family heme-binding protein [Stellaceae bacterium]
MKHLSIATAMAGILLVAGPAAWAQKPPPPTPYGTPISLAMAKKAAHAALAQAAKQEWPEAVAIVGPAGRLVLFEKMDNTQYGSIHLAIRKAQTAAMFRQPSQNFENITKKFPAILGLEGAMPIGGGVPLVVDGKIVGAIGASGAPFSAPDDKVAGAGTAVVK